MTLPPRQEVLPRASRFAIGDRVRVTRVLSNATASVPAYLQGCRGVIERLVDPTLVEPDRNRKRQVESFQHYRIIVPLSDLWPQYTGSPRDDLHLEVCEPWLKHIS